MNVSTVTGEKGTRYFGSVRFYKHLIYLSLLLVGLFALIGLCFVGSIIISGELLAAPGDPRGVPQKVASQAHANLSENGSSPSPAGLAGVPRIDYQLKYPSLYGGSVQFAPIPKEKTAYLTFDDGPSPRTLEILRILGQQNVKATFFVIAKNADPDILRRIVADGHTLGIHSYTHRYDEIYDSVEAYLDDFNAAYESIYRATSIRPRIFRFPGGSINAYDEAIYQEILSEMLRRRFVFFDWNMSIGDASPGLNSENLVNIAKASVRDQGRLVILAHDSAGKAETVKALPEIIEFLKDKGYAFSKLDSSVEPVVFAYP